MSILVMRTVRNNLGDCYLHYLTLVIVQVFLLILPYKGREKLPCYIYLTSALLGFSGSDRQEENYYQNYEEFFEQQLTQDQERTPSDFVPTIASRVVPVQIMEQPVTITENDPLPENSTETAHLDQEILTLLGDAPKDDTPTGRQIHKDIASRLNSIIQNGLKKDLKDKIIDEYPVPENCLLFKSPLLNPEIKAAVSETLQKKDSSLASRQSQIGSAIAILANVMDILVNDKTGNNQNIIKHVSDASRLLCDSHYIDTKVRRSFLISTLNNKLKETLKDTQRDKTLFGECLAERLKASKAITRTSQDLRPFKPKQTARIPASNTNNLNWKHPQPQQAYPRKPLTSVQRPAGTAHRNEHLRRPTTSNPRPSGGSGPRTAPRYYRTPNK